MWSASSPGIQISMGNLCSPVDGRNSLGCLNLVPTRWSELAGRIGRLEAFNCSAGGLRLLCCQCDRWAGDSSRTVAGHIWWEETMGQIRHVGNPLSGDRQAEGGRQATKDRKTHIVLRNPKHRPGLAGWKMGATVCLLDIEATQQAQGCLPAAGLLQ